MSIESPADWKGLTQVANVVRLTLDTLAEHVRPGVTTGELDAMAKRVIAAHGARSAPAIVYGFPGTVLISVNDEVVHGIPGSRRIRAGDIVKLDVTLEKDGYVADAARSVIVPPGRPVARAGVRVNEIGRAVEDEVRRRGFTVMDGLSGHGVGRTIHEPPTVANTYVPFQQDILTEGLVLTIEPMISAGSSYPVQDADGWTLRTRDGSLAAHCEHTLVITRGTPLILAA
jgi:methionyl aminopeptidase